MRQQQQQQRNDPPQQQRTIVLLPLEFTPGHKATFQSTAAENGKNNIIDLPAVAAVAPKPLRGDDLNGQELPAGVPLLQLYISFLACCAAAWLVYLLLPRGCKKAYFFRRRNNKQNNEAKKNDSHYSDKNGTTVPKASANDDEDDWYTFAPFSMTPSPSAKQRGGGTSSSFSAVGSQSNFTGVGSISVQDSILAATEARRRRDNNDSSMQKSEWETVPMDDNNNKSRDGPGMMPMGVAYSDADLENHETPYKGGGGQQQRYANSSLPSPDHPQINPLPTEAVWRECYRRLQGTGMRLTAHGVQCPSKRIWLQYSSEESTLLWQTEFPRQLPSTAARASTVWVRGAMHRIPAGNVLYIDVGKKTTALLQTPASVQPTTCFSLLTQAGSLDLQANSKLERDAVVSALSYILDIVHQGADWRRLYDESSTIINGAPSSVAPPSNVYNASAGILSNIGSDLFPPGPNEI